MSPRRRDALALAACLLATGGSGQARGGALPEPPAPRLAATAPAPAGIDTLDVEAVLARRRARLDSLLLLESVRFDTTGVASVADSLDRGGAAAVRAHTPERLRPAGRTLQLDLEPLAMSTYNRIEGLRAGLGLEPRVGRVHAEIAGGYGFSNRRGSGRAGVAFGKQGEPLLRFEWADLVEPFGPEPERHSAGLLALVAGQDRRDYLRCRHLEAALQPWRRESGSVGLRLFERRQSPVAAATGFSLFGGNLPIDAPNPSADAGTIRGASVEAHLGRPADRLEVAAEAGVAGGDFDYAWQNARLTMRRIFPDGGVVALEIEAVNTGGTPPVQARAFLGGDANLRGYERLEFVGRRRASARLEYALGVDLLQRTRLPILEKLHLQFVPFADLGTTWGEARGVDRSRGTLAGALRGSFGLGLQRTLWLPGLEAVRLDIVQRTDGRGHGPSLWFRVVGLDL